jgi:Bax protein
MHGITEQQTFADTTLPQTGFNLTGDIDIASPLRNFKKKLFPKGTHFHLPLQLTGPGTSNINLASVNIADIAVFFAFYPKIIRLCEKDSSMTSPQPVRCRQPDHNSGERFGLHFSTSLFLFLSTLWLGSVDPTYAAKPYPDQAQVVEFHQYQDLLQEFKRQNYQLNHLSSGVPAIILKALPENLTAISSTERKKSLFFQALLPMVLLANAEITKERATLSALKKALAKQPQLTPAQRRSLAELARKYEVSTQPPLDASTINQLLPRIDTVPADLALAQAAIESAWGTSRFARLGNNLFGQKTQIQGAGIVPRERPAQATYEIKKFDDPYQSVRAYMHNLNSHPLYKKFRQLRAQKRTAGTDPRSTQLVPGLLHYSTRRQAYIDDLRSIIRTNKLERFATAELRR